MTSAYCNKLPNIQNEGYVPSVQDPDIYDLSQLEEKILKFHGLMLEVENVSLINAANFGNWLEVAFNRFQNEKKSGNVRFPNFGTYVKETCKISDFYAKQMRNFYTFANQYPQILHCRLSLAFFKTNQKYILEYFKSHPSTATGWQHQFDCSCMQCGPLKQDLPQQQLGSACTFSQHQNFLHEYKILKNIFDPNCSWGQEE